jgi:hypothetical protein
MSLKVEKHSIEKTKEQKECDTRKKNEDEVKK